MEEKKLAKYLRYDQKLEEITRILKKNQNQLYPNEKNNYTAEKLMMLLDNEKLAALEDEFNEHPNGIELPNFIWLMKSAISHPPEDKYELVNGLIKLFQEIDINGDGQMEWSEFTQYIIDAVIGENDAKFFDARFEKDREMNENEILNKAYQRKTMRYELSKIWDDSTHSSFIKKINYCQMSDQLLVLEQNSKKLKFYYTESHLNANEWKKKQEEADKLNYEKSRAEYLQKGTTSKTNKFQKKQAGVIETLNQKESLTLPVEERSDKSFIIDFCIADSLSMIGCVTSDRQFFFWENNPHHRLLKNFKTDVLQTGIWYLPQHQVWISAGADYFLRTWVWSQHAEDENIQVQHQLNAHLKQITKVVEIYLPKLVASSSLDGKIRLWDLAEQSCITELKDPSNSASIKGIKGMNYQYEYPYGGNLLSFGFENHVNVWCPEISLTRSFIGKLEGHSSIVVCCEFIPATPNLITIDDKSNIRIWDIRTLGAVQVLTAEKGASFINDVAIMTKHDKFVLGGKRLIFFDNSAVSANIRNFSDDVYALAVDFNQYYNFFVVLTKIDIRIYDAMTGRLKKVFNDLNQQKFNVDLTTFCFGGRERKFFISDNAGNIRLYNMKNGEFCKDVNQKSEIEQSEFANKIEHIKKKDNNEVSTLIYLSEEKLLITGSWDSTIRIYDESEPEESVLLRILSGGHQNSEIIQLTYSAHLSLLASGSGNGIIAIWDFETCKLQALLLDHTQEITSLEFIEPYPLLASAGLDGFICIWGIHKNLEYQYRYKCVLKLVNLVNLKKEKLLIAVNSIVSDTSQSKGITKSKEIMQFYQHSDYESLLYEPQKQIDKDQLKLEQSRISKIGHNKKSLYMKKLEEENAQQAKGQPTIDGNANVQPPSNTFFDFQEDNEKYQKSISEERPRCYLYCSDAKGYVFILNLEFFLKRKGIKPIIKEKTSQSYQLRRKDLINETKKVENLILAPRAKLDIYHPFSTVLLRKWEAHSGNINKISKIKDPQSYVTCSSDKHVKIWSPEGYLYADVNLVKLENTMWKFPFDWVKLKLKEIDFVFEALKLIEKDEIKNKDQIKAKYLVSKYFHGDYPIEKYLLQQQLEDEQDEEIKMALVKKLKQHNHQSQPKQTSQQQQQLIDVQSELERIHKKQSDTKSGHTIDQQLNNQSQVDFNEIRERYWLPYSTVDQRSNYKILRNFSQCQDLAKFMPVEMLFKFIAENPDIHKQFNEELNTQYDMLQSQYYHYIQLQATLNHKQQSQSSFQASKSELIIKEQMKKEKELLFQRSEQIINLMNQQKIFEKFPTEKEILSKKKRPKTTTSISTLQRLQENLDKIDQKVDGNFLTINKKKSSIEDQQFNYLQGSQNQKTMESSIKKKRLITHKHQISGLFLQKSIQLQKGKHGYEVRNIQTHQEKRKKKQMISSMSPSLFMKNKAITGNINSELLKPKNTEIMNVKYRMGESLRALKLQTLNQEAKFDSKSQTLLCDNNDILRKHKKFYRDLSSQAQMSFYSKQQPNVSELNESQVQDKKKDKQKSEKKVQILASKTFMHNAKKNKHKILKSKNKLYVL